MTILTATLLLTTGVLAGLRLSVVLRPPCRHVSHRQPRHVRVTA